MEWLESAAEGIALLRPQTAAKLRCPDTLRLTYQPDGEGLCANVATDFLDRILPLLDEEPRIGVFQVPELYLKKGDMAEALARAFTWLNAKVVVRAAKPALAEYHTWYFLTSIVSDDRWEDVFAVTINAQSGAAVRLPDPLTALDLEPNPAPEPETALTYRNAIRQANEQMQQRSAAFVSRLEARLQRDRRRLRDYYNALLREATSRISKSKTEQDRDKQDARRRAVELELRRKLSDLNDRYAIRAELVPLVLVRVGVQVLAVHCEVFRKQAHKTHIIYWNPLLKELEPMCCSACGASGFALAFTDSDVRPLCAGCAG